MTVPPGGPAGPLGPGTPTSPVEPRAPTNPCLPVAPVAPVAPGGPGGPVKCSSASCNWLLSNLYLCTLSTVRTKNDVGRSSV